ncbi:hypothetical protein LCGC14_1381970 [marine sediment metagenome]|uniref:Uncharacterized protein n=1 Tax=marine sediment metagenome TaxID=412755 RepID=A0A0F9K2N2_9ZZZZ
MKDGIIDQVRQEIDRTDHAYNTLEQLVESEFSNDENDSIDDAMNELVGAKSALVDWLDEYERENL